MSSKRLSRSAVEGGRAARNKNDRYDSNREQRAVAREYCYKSKVDPEYADGSAPKVRKKVGKDFDDHLGAMYRWLRSHVGQPWDAVRSKAHKLYDSRTTAGRHILYDHLIRSVNPHRLSWSNGFDFGVAEDGTLQYTDESRFVRSLRVIARERRAVKYPGDWANVSREQLFAWAGHRKVIDYGAVQYWTAEPSRMTWGACHHNNCYYPGKMVDVVFKYPASTWSKPRAVHTKERHCYHPILPAYRQGKRFSKKEEAFWKTVHPLSRLSLVFDKDNK